MMIRVHKGPGKPHTLVCVRDDGSVTGDRLKGEFGPFHDLAHYVVETELGRRDSFYAMIARGMDVRDFEKPGTAAGLPPEAIETEAIVMRLQAELAYGDQPADGPELSDATLERLRRRLREVMGRWAAVEPGEALELEFRPG